MVKSLLEVGGSSAVVITEPLSVRDVALLEVGTQLLELGFDVRRFIVLVLSCSDFLYLFLVDKSVVVRVLILLELFWR